MVGKIGIQPSEFWQMSPQEAWLIVDEKKPPKMVGNLTEETFEQLQGMLHG